MRKVHIIEQEQDRIQSVVFSGLALFPCPVKSWNKDLTFNLLISVSQTLLAKFAFLSRWQFKKQAVILLSGYCQTSELSIIWANTSEGYVFSQPLCWTSYKNYSKLFKIRAGWVVKIYKKKDLGNPKNTFSCISNIFILSTLFGVARGTYLNCKWKKKTSIICSSGVTGQNFHH